MHAIVAIVLIYIAVISIVALFFIFRYYIIQIRSNNKHELVSDSLKLKWLKDRLTKPGTNVIRISGGYKLEFQEGINNTLFSKITLTIDSKNLIKLIASLRVKIPEPMDIRGINPVSKAWKGSSSSEENNEDYTIYSDISKFWNKILSKSEIDKILKQQAPSINRYYLQGESLEILSYYDLVMYDFIRMTELIHKEITLQNIVFITKKVEQLVCYNCKDPYDIHEENCTLCGAPRPRCIVCLLDLYPSESEEEVVTTPCCGVYAHKDHIIKWLKQDPRCPNCHKNISHWLGQMQIS
jgi:transposase-like protein